MEHEICLIVDFDYFLTKLMTKLSVFNEKNITQKIISTITDYRNAVSYEVLCFLYNWLRQRGAGPDDL